MAVKNRLRYKYTKEERTRFDMWHYRLYTESMRIWSRRDGRDGGFFSAALAEALAEGFPIDWVPAGSDPGCRTVLFNYLTEQITRYLRIASPEIISVALKNGSAILAAGASPDCRDAFGKPLILYCTGSRLPASVLKMLLDAGADPGAADSYGNTAFKDCSTEYVFSGSETAREKCLLLIAAGADAKLDGPLKYCWAGLEQQERFKELERFASCRAERRALERAGADAPSFDYSM